MGKEDRRQRAERQSLDRGGLSKPVPKGCLKECTEDCFYSLYTCLFPIIGGIGMIGTILTLFGLLIDFDTLFYIGIVCLVGLVCAHLFVGIIVCMLQPYIKNNQAAVPWQVPTNHQPLVRTDQYNANHVSHHTPIMYAISRQVPQVPTNQTIERTDQNYADHVDHDPPTIPGVQSPIGGNLPSYQESQMYTTPSAVQILTTQSRKNDESNTDSSDTPRRAASVSSNVPRRTAASDSNDVLRMAALMLNDRADQNEPPPPSYEDVMNV